MIPAKVKAKILPFQIEGVDFLKDRTNALLADEMGTGKTLQALTALSHAATVKALIICPASVKYNWEREVRDWGFPWSVQVVESNKDQLKDTNITIINYEQVINNRRRFELYNRTWTHLICDESHYCKNFSTKRTEAILGAQGIKNKCARRWMMTGTPVLNRPVELYPLLKSLIPEKLGKYSRWLSFTSRYCEGHYGLWGYDATGASHIEELAEVLGGFMLRRLKKDIMSELPQKTYEKVLVNSKTKCELDELKTAMRQEVGLAKIDAAVAHIKDILEQKDKVVVFGYHREVLETLRNKLTAFSPILVYGGIDSKKKDDLVQKFINDPKSRVFIGNILSAGVGVNGLQRVTDTAVFVELVYTPGAVHQACDRLHREGQRQAVLIQFMVIKDTIDEEMIDTIIGKERVIHKITRDDKETLRFTIPNQTTTKKEKVMEKLVSMLDAFIDALAERVVSKMGGKVQIVEPPKVEEPEAPKAAKKKVKREEEVAPPVAQEEAAPCEVEVSGATPEQVDSVRSVMRSYLNGISSPADVKKKKALAEALNTRVPKEVGQLSPQGLGAKECDKYIGILVEEFTKQFGGEVWASIAP